MYTIDGIVTDLEAFIADYMLEAWESADLRAMSVGETLTIDGGFAPIEVARNV